jgi:phage shock protein E
VKHVSATEAHTSLSEGGVYLDVRSSVEFAQGHPAHALNIPFFEPDEDTGIMQPNPDFLRVVQAVVPAETRLFVGCQAGGRSARAVQVLESYGFINLTNVRGGFGGSNDPAGRVEPGWVASGLPVEADVDTPPEHTYQELLAQADAAE